MTLVCWALPLLEPRVSGCEQNFVCRSFKRALVSLVDCCFPDRKPTAFHSQMLRGCPLLALVLWAREIDLGSRPYASQGKPLHLRKISLQNLSCHCWEWGYPFSNLCSSYQSPYGFFCKSLVMRLLFS